MRIAQVLTASTGGIGRHVGSLVPRFVDRGHQVRIFCPELTAQSQGFAALGVVSSPLIDLAQARAADVVHAHGYKAGGLVAAMTPFGGPPFVLTWHNAVLGTTRSAAVGRLVQRVLARTADLTLGASADLVAEAVRLGARDARLGPVAAPVLRPARESRDQLRRSLGLAPTDVMVLSVTRLAPQKNLGMLADIARDVRERSELRFVVVGEGPERASLQARIAAEGSRVALLGHRDDISDLLAAADVALLTSTWEARALVAQEALLAGVPLLSTRVGGIEELVGNAAMLVGLDDVPDAVKGLLRLADDPRERLALSRAGLDRAATWPDEDQVAETLLSVYEDLLGRHDAD